MSERLKFIAAYLEYDASFSSATSPAPLRQLKSVTHVPGLLCHPCARLLRTDTIASSFLIAACGEVCALCARMSGDVKTTSRARVDYE
jgi:hypothetical protein